MATKNKPIDFDLDVDIPDLSGKVFLVTGGNSGLGKESILQLSKHRPERIYLTARSALKGEKAIQDIISVVPEANVSFVELDLGSLASVQQGAKQVLQEAHRLDVIVANAGIMDVPPGLTEDGYEIQFGTNHLGHALLIQLLLPLLSRSDGRVVVLTSLGAGLAPSTGIQFEGLKTQQENLSFLMAGYARYGQSKLANILYPRELVRRHPEVVAVAVHPGVVNTELILEKKGILGRSFIKFTNWIQGFPLLSPQEGVCNQLWASTTDKRNLKSGSWYEPVGKPGRKFKNSEDDELAKRLYDWTEKELDTWMQ